MNRTDEELVQLAKDGDQDAYAALYDRCRSHIRSVVFKIMRRYPDDIEDAVQETMLRVFNALPRFNGTCKFRTWVHRIAVNYALGTYRSRKVSPLALSDPLESDDYGEIVTVQIPDEERGYAIFEANKDLPLVMDRLRPIFRKSLEYRFLRGMRDSEAAKELDLSEATVKNRVCRALREARKIVDEMNLPIEKRQCIPCQKVGRFRFADKLNGGEPVCKWCATAGNPAAEVVRTGKTLAWNKVCRCGCGQPFVAHAAATRYIEGHKPATAAKRVQKTPARSFPASPKPVLEAQLETARLPAMPVPSEEMVTVNIPVRALDQMLATLTTADKVRAFEFLLKEPA